MIIIKNNKKVEAVKTVFMVSMTIIYTFCFDGSPKYNGMKSDSV